MKHVGNMFVIRVQLSLLDLLAYHSSDVIPFKLHVFFSARNVLENV